MEEIMIGVVLWSDISDRKAVIWCEDQGDLAYLNSSQDMWPSDAFFDAGDVVQFDMEMQSTMRRAHNPRLVVERAGAGLPDALRVTATGRNAPRKTARILQFEPQRRNESECRARVSDA